MGFCGILMFVIFVPYNVCDPFLGFDHCLLKKICYFPQKIQYILQIAQLVLLYLMIPQDPQTENF